MKQKLGLACALIHTPKVLLLDEPTNGVDPVSRRDFWRILYQLLREHVTIFVSTAYLDEAERCNRVGLLHQGRLLAVDTPRRVKRLMRGALLEIRGQDPRQMAAVLRASLPAGTVTLFGDRVHVLTGRATDGSGEVERLLAPAAGASRASGRSSRRSKTCSCRCSPATRRPRRDRTMNSDERVLAASVDASNAASAASSR
jgi:ABC-2 type transport system ATP-binding protein